MRVHVVANPTAGRGRVPRLVEAVGARLIAAGAAVATHWTRGPGDARAHVAALPPASLDRLVVVGGDGTLHEVVNALPPPLPWPVALVPVGTANLVARDAGLPLRARPDRLARIVLEGRPWEVDLLETDRGLALAVAGVGLDAEIVSAVAGARGGKAGGYARWVRPIARAFLDYSPPDLEVVVDDGPAVRGGAVVVQNTLCYGGLFTLHPRARLDDGRLEVVVFLHASRRDWFRLALEAFAGRVAKDRGVRLLSGTRVVVRSSRPAPVQTDGDPAGETPLSAQVVPRALTLLR
jgi:diacylglycerol kinase family enzyme